MRITNRIQNGQRIFFTVAVPDPLGLFGERYAFVIYNFETGKWVVEDNPTNLPKADFVDYLTENLYNKFPKIPVTPIFKRMTCHNGSIK